MPLVGGPRARFVIGLGLLALLVAVPAVVIARLHGFDGLYGQDAFAYADYGLGPLRSALLAGHAPPGFPLPPGYPLLVSLASFIVGPSPAVALGISLLAGALIPVLVALLAHEAAPGISIRVALLAGLVAAVAGQLWQSSFVTMADTPAAAAATFGALATCRFHRTGGRAWLAVAAAALALAVETRLVFVVVAAVFGLLVLGRLVSDKRGEVRRGLVGAAIGLLTVAVVLTPAGLAIASAVAASRPIPFAVELGVATFDPLTPFRSTFVTADGHLAYAWPMLLWTALQPVHWYWLGALGLAVPVGLATVLRQSDRHASTAAALVAWPVIVLLVLAHYPYQNPRFFLAMLPPMAILAAIGVGATWDALRTRTPRARAVAGGVLIAAVGLNLALAWRYADGFAARQAADVAEIRSLEAAIPAGSPIASLGATPLLRHDGREVTELFDLSPTAASDLVAAGPLYVVVDATSMDGQWAGTPTGRAFEIVASARGFVSVAKAGAWTLYRSGA